MLYFPDNYAIYIFPCNVNSVLSQFFTSCTWCETVNCPKKFTTTITTNDNDDDELRSRFLNILVSHMTISQGHREDCPGFHGCFFSVHGAEAV